MLSTAFIACKKEQAPSLPNASTMSSAASHSQISINIGDMVAKIPKTILYNMGDSIKLYSNYAQWIWQEKYLQVRIPLSLSSTTFLCGIKYYDKPDETLVYISDFTPDEGSSNKSFTGTQIWLNLQDWHLYGYKYDSDSIVGQLTPIKITDSNWEATALENKSFTLDKNNKIVLANDSNTTASIMSGDPLDCPDWNTGNFWSNIGDWFTGIGEGIGNFFNNLHYEKPTADGNGGGDYSYGFGPGGVYPGGGFAIGGGGTGMGPGTGASGGGNLPPEEGGNEPPNGGNNNSPIIGGNSNGGSSIDTISTPIIDFELPDSNGYYPSRIVALSIYAANSPSGDGVIDCHDLEGLLGSMWPVWQSLALNPPDLYVLQRMDIIRNTYPDRYDQNSFKITTISDAQGTKVNCDFFALHINTLPKNANGNTMSRTEFLDFIRHNLGNMNVLGDNMSCNYGYYDDASNNGLNDQNTFNDNNPYALGSLAHFNNNLPYSLGFFFDDGSVIESEYADHPESNYTYFIYTTIKSPLDGDHPVSGNRMFGIKADPNGGYMLYIVGVDRVTGAFVSTVNKTINAVFSGADQWWKSVIKGTMNYVNSHNGNASYYNNTDNGLVFYRRPDWEGNVKLYLTKQITFAELKILLNCP